MALYGLLIGIDRYHPDSGVNPLTGCVNDITAFQTYLARQFPPEQLHLTVLLNEAASRAGVIAAFSELLETPISAGDIVLIYYAGHGSTAPTAQAFVDLGLDTRGQDETLVLYDSRTPGCSDLADKELALLLTSFPQKVEIIVILDACHSGSATRAVNTATRPMQLGPIRFTPAAAGETAKNLGAYLTTNQYDYSKMEPLTLPTSRHLLLSACGRDELAYETASSSGLFSGCLLRLLKDFAAPPSYPELFERLSALVSRSARTQHPQLKVYGGFNPDRQFLRLDHRLPAAMRQVAYDSTTARWMLDAGALHGLPVDPAEYRELPVTVYETLDPSANRKSANISQVLLAKSVLQFKGNKKKVYFASIIQPATLTVLLKGTPDQVDEFLRLTGGKKAYYPLVNFLRKEAWGQSRFHLNVETNQLVIQDPSGALVHGIAAFNQDTVAYILRILRQIAKWFRLALLENPFTTLDLANIHWSLETQLDDETWQQHTTHDITLVLPAIDQAIPYRFRMQNTTGQPLYAGIYYLTSDYRIKKLTPDVDASEFTAGKKPGLIEPGLGLCLESNASEDTDIFKFVVSDRLFPDYFLEEDRAIVREILPAIPGTAKAFRRGRRQENQWAALTITVRLAR